LCGSGHNGGKAQYILDLEANTETIIFKADNNSRVLKLFPGFYIEKLPLVLVLDNECVKVFNMKNR